MLAQADADYTTGAIAALVAIVSVGGGKYMVAHLYAQDFLKPASEFVIDDDHAKIYLIDKLVDESTEEGKALKWPEGKDADSAETLDDYPADLRKDAQTRWDAMSVSDREGYKAAIKAEFDYVISQAASEMEAEDFFGNIGGMDILFCALAVITAFRVGAGGLGGGND